jgi:hypothetical protein
MLAQDMEIIAAIFGDSVIREGFGKITATIEYPLSTFGKIFFIAICAIMPLTRQLIVETPFTLMAFERLKFPPPWIAGQLIVGISLLLFMSAYPLYIEIPINIILGYVAYPFVFKLFKVKISSFLSNKEFSTLKRPEQSLFF